MRRAPSMKTLQALHWLTDVQRMKARNLIKGATSPDVYPDVSSWLQQCYNRPTWVERVMVALNQLMETHGTEPLWHGGELKAEYCNTGDSYCSTIIYRYDTGTFSVGSWGDLVERHNWNGA